MARQPSAPTVGALVAPDSFKGTFSAIEVAEALARGVETATGEPADRCPLADGGEGTGDVLAYRLGGRREPAAAHDPLGRRRPSWFTLLPDGTAVVEVAAASGLALVAPSERDPLAATSRGTGELVAAAASAGAGTILVACGGSATVDGGAGALEGIEERGGIGRARLVCLCDVRTPWERAAEVFGPQKGASPAAVALLSRRLDELAARLPRDPRGRAMTGAAGGISGALWAAYGAALVPGARYVIEALDVPMRLRRARFAIVGEGRLDATTLEGKLVEALARRAAVAGVPVFAAVGANALDPDALVRLGLRSVVEATTLEALERAGAELARLGLEAPRRPTAPSRRR
ncbi:MAG TPA: glycerate kinase [Acidimicrobiales bacterium]|nr:glycerate kinase [Acidimicrobiales bacterium]